MNRTKFFNILFFIIIFFCLLFSNSVLACKDIIATGDATAGDFNILMKVRDPSRAGMQVLCIVPEGYQYNYHNPWNGKSITFTTEKKYIGVASESDIIPDIVKAGMTLTEAGLAFGDADTNSGWKNPTKYAWDDFDWIRYACEKARDEKEAVSLLTIDLVDEMHASSVSENLFIIGPKTGFVIEADAYHYDITEVVDDVLAYSNYPKKLWSTQVHNLLTIAPNFDFTKEKTVRKGETIRLNSLRGIRILEINSEGIIAKQVPFIKTFQQRIILNDKKIEIKLGERKTIGDFSVELLDLNDNKATVKVCYVFKAWEDKIMEIITPNYGSIDVKDMINWSRLHKEDLDGLRGICQKVVTSETVAIYKIPKKYYNILSMGWFSPNHACSSIYIPFHICNKAIEDAYTHSDAANLCLNLLNEYGSGTLSDIFKKTEDVFIYENDLNEQIAIETIEKNKDASDFVTIADMGMQRQAYYTEEIWMELTKISNKEQIKNILSKIWTSNYSKSLDKMQNAFANLSALNCDLIILEKIANIGLDICKTKIDTLDILNKNITVVKDEYKIAENQIKQGAFTNGFEILKKAYQNCELILQGNNPYKNIKKDQENLTNFLPIIALIIISTFIIILIKKKKRN